MALLPDTTRHEGVQTDDRSDTRLEKPRLWQVLLHNDDYTTQEFVVWVLETVFQQPRAEAFAIMMRVHRSGLGIAGVFTKDVAETKAAATRRLAEQHEYPLLVTMEPAPEPEERRR
jgi:ATP-dependent Clp protease adaptor protein ClpS